MSGEKELRDFPVRRSRAGKDAFLSRFRERAEELGYTASEEKGGMLGSRNLVMGDPDRAEVILAAHYDTPANHLFPDLLMPGHPALTLLLEILKAVLLLLPAFAVYYAAWTFLGARAFPVFPLTYIALLAVQTAGWAEKHNEGLDCALETLLHVMERLPEEKRSRAAFVLFDHGETGHAGARQFARQHVQSAYTRLMVQLDRLAPGTRPAMICFRQARKARGYFALERALKQDDGCDVFSSSPLTPPSDASSFVCGVRIMACSPVPLLGPVMGLRGEGNSAAAETVENALVRFLTGKEENEEGQICPDSP